MSRVETKKQEKKVIMKRKISLAIICIMLITLILSVAKTLPAAPTIYVIGENVQLEKDTALVTR